LIYTWLGSPVWVESRVMTSGKPGGGQSSENIY